MTKAILHLYLKSFYLYRFVFLTIFLNTIYFFYCKSFLLSDNFTIVDFFKFNYYGTRFDTDFIGGIMWLSHFVILLFFIGLCFENYNTSSVIFILSRISKTKWYISSLVFIVTISLIYLLLQLFTIFCFYIFYYSFSFEICLFFDSLHLIAIAWLSMLLIISLFYFLCILINLKYSFLLVVSLLITSTFWFQKNLLLYIPGMLGVLRVYGHYNLKIILINLFYLTLLIYLNYRLLRGRNIIETL